MKNKMYRKQNTKNNIIPIIQNDHLKHYTNGRTLQILTH